MRAERACKKLEPELRVSASARPAERKKQKEAERAEKRKADEKKAA